MVTSKPERHCDLAPEDWQYRDEGGANIVLAYIGNDDAFVCHHERVSILVQMFWPRLPLAKSVSVV